MFIINGVPEKDRVLKFTKLGDYLCDKAYDSVTNILVFGFETLEGVFQQTARKTRRGSLVVIIHSFVLFYFSLRS
jgi:hypothetical protein